MGAAARNGVSRSGNSNTPGAPTAPAVTNILRKVVVTTTQP
jgi:hypothetical protein